ncbi:MAG: TonB-dependent receptor [Opitutaceae bacterium]|nr:TonB-dependent receptor [Opitutaceae bacterium]
MKLASGLPFLFLATAGVILATEPPLELPEFAVDSSRVALQEPSGTFAMPVTALRFEPLADVQARNLAEAQADIGIRGGIFENTGFRIGAAALYDPQTGHYFAEIPVTPAMLTAPRILTGVDNALGGFNANVGTIAYDWRRIRSHGEMTASAGQYDSYRGSLYEGVVADAPVAGRTFAADAEVSRSISDGSVPYGDHRFQRYNVRLQLAGATSQTDLFAGYQAKFFGWPNLYTPFGSNETENLKTVLVALNHRLEWGPGDWFEAGVFWRRNRDNYAFNRFAPVGPVPPFLHTTWTNGASISGHEDLGTWAFGFNAAVLADDLKSTSLIYGGFHTRTYAKLGFTPEKYWLLGNRCRLTLRTGITYDDTNRDGSAVSPLVELALDGTRSGGRARRLYFSYAKSTQVPTYTALNSSPNAGLFRGNPNLGRSTSHNLELGRDETQGAWQTHVAVFYRRDDRLVDWTFQQGVTARTANAVDLDTVGAEAVVRWSMPHYEIIVGYTFLHKSADYGPATVTASFYALNFPKQRLTVAVVARLGGGFELRMDNQARIQEGNPLRTMGGSRAVISSLGLFYRPPLARNLDLSLQVDNLWNSSFQTVPAVPAARRQISAGMTCRW